MRADLTIRRARLVLPDRVVTGDLQVEDGVITSIAPSCEGAGREIDGTGLTVLPGAIDPQVHISGTDPDLCETLTTGSRAAAAGGVTSIMDEPVPACRTSAQVEAHTAQANQHCLVHHGRYLAASRQDLSAMKGVQGVCGVRVRGDWGAPGRDDDLESLFRQADQLLVVYLRDALRLEDRGAMYEDSVDVRDHPRVFDAEGSEERTARALELAHKHGRRVHLLHVSTAGEVQQLREADRTLVSASVCPQHLFMDADHDYARLGTLAQCVPPVRAAHHARALWQGLVDGVVDMVTSNHRAVRLPRKRMAYPLAASGMPNVEWTLPLLLDQVSQGNCSLRQVAKWTSEAPARAFGLRRKGRLEVGYDADLVLVDEARQRVIRGTEAHTACGWSPWEGQAVTGWPVLTVVAGHVVFERGAFDELARGRPLSVTRPSMMRGSGLD